MISQWQAIRFRPRAKCKHMIARFSCVSHIWCDCFCLFFSFINLNPFIFLFSTGAFLFLCLCGVWGGCVTATQCVWDLVTQWPCFYWVTNQQSGVAKTSIWAQLDSVSPSTALHCVCIFQMMCTNWSLCLGHTQCMGVFFILHGCEAVTYAWVLSPFR